VTPAWVRPVNFLLSRAFPERGRATLLLGGFFAVTLCAAAPEAATPRRRDGGAARPPGRHSRISGRLCLLGGAAARRKRGSASLGTVEGPRGPLYVQRLIFSAGAARKAYGLASLLNRWALQGNLRRVSHASSAQDDLSGPMVRGKRPRRCLFGIFGGGPCPARPWQLDPPPIGP